MRYPTLVEQPSYREVVDVFGGYNHNARISDGEFYDMKNLSSDAFPSLSPRGKRGVYLTPDNPQGIIAKDSLCFIDGTDFVMNEYRVDMGLSTEESDSPKTMVSMGAYVIIMPDKKYINTADLSDFGDIEAEFKTNLPVTFSLARMDSSEYNAEFIQSSEPKEPANMTLWIDTSSKPHVLKQWSETNGMWVSIATTYVKISSAGIGAAFEKFDGIHITGLQGAALMDETGQPIPNAADLEALEGTAVVWDKGDDFITVVGMLDVTRTITNSVTISRQMPNMDFIIESENRLWGCRYGIAANGEVVNELYASKLGDFKNWNCFMGLSTDSYAASVGTDGAFTGAVTHLGYPLFFKENFLHKVYGNFPSNFQIQTTACRGVQSGCERSLAIVNEVLYYKSRNAVCAYDGSLPAEMSSVLGEVRYGQATAAAHGNKLYINMVDSTGEWVLMVYDTARGLWHKEDDLRVDAFCSCRDELYYIDHDTKAIKTMMGSGTLDKEPVEWMAQTGVIGIDAPDRKYITRMTVRMLLEPGAKAKFFARYDSTGEWEHLFTMTGTSLRSFAVPIRPRRCDHFQIRIEAQGDGAVYSVAKILEQGSDRW